MTTQLFQLLIRLKFTSQPSLMSTNINASVSLCKKERIWPIRFVFVLFLPQRGFVIIKASDTPVPPSSLPTLGLLFFWFATNQVTFFTIMMIFIALVRHSCIVVSIKTFFCALLWCCSWFDFFIGFFLLLCSPNVQHWLNPDLKTWSCWTIFFKKKSEHDGVLCKSDQLFLRINFESFHCFCKNMNDMPRHCLFWQNATQQWRQEEVMTLWHSAAERKQRRQASCITSGDVAGCASKNDPKNDKRSRQCQNTKIQRDEKMLNERVCQCVMQHGKCHVLQNEVRHVLLKCTSKLVSSILSLRGQIQHDCNVSAPSALVIGYKHKWHSWCVSIHKWKHNQTCAWHFQFSPKSGSLSAFFILVQTRNVAIGKHLCVWPLNKAMNESINQPMNEALWAWCSCQKSNCLCFCFHQAGCTWQTNLIWATSFGETAHKACQQQQTATNGNDHGDQTNHRADGTWWQDCAMNIECQVSFARLMMNFVSCTEPMAPKSWHIQLCASCASTKTQNLCFAWTSCGPSVTKS